MIQRCQRKPTDHPDVPACGAPLAEDPDTREIRCTNGHPQHRPVDPATLPREIVRRGEGKQDSRPRQWRTRLEEKREQTA